MSWRHGSTDRTVISTHLRCLPLLYLHPEHLSHIAYRQSAAQCFAWRRSGDAHSTSKIVSLNHLFRVSLCVLRAAHAPNSRKIPLRVAYPGATSRRSTRSNHPHTDTISCNLSTYATELWRRYGHQESQAMVQRLSELRLALVALAALIIVAAGIGDTAADYSASRIHRIAVQINSDDVAPMKHAISNSVNLVRYYRSRHQPVKVDIVAYGSGIAMFRADISPVASVLNYIKKNFPEIAFTVCGNTKSIIERQEGHRMPLVSGTNVVPFGIVRLVTLQEKGWSYIRP